MKVVALAFATYHSGIAAVSVDSDSASTAQGKIIFI